MGVNKRVGQLHSGQGCGKLTTCDSSSHCLGSLKRTRSQSTLPTSPPHPTTTNSRSVFSSPISCARSALSSITNAFRNSLVPSRTLFPSTTQTPARDVAPSAANLSAMDFTPVPLRDAMDSPLLSSPISPLTELSRSPSPPSELDLDALSSADSSMLSSLSSSMVGSPAPESSQMDGSTSDERPTKRRRISADPKPRLTHQLDLTSAALSDGQEDQLDKLMNLIQNRRKIVVVAGAGISVSAGIPDFRSSKGLFKSLKKQHNLKSSGKDLFDASVYKDANSTSSFHQMVRQLSEMTKEAEPTPFHHMLAKLASEDRLLRLYTQNVDGLDTSMESLKTNVPLNRKGPWPKTIQLHGGLQKMVCSKCNDMTDLAPDLFDGPTPPLCEQCVAADNARTEYAGKRSHGIGRLRPRMVLYNEHNPDDEAIGAVVKSDLRTRPDALIVVGTTLKIPGVKRIVKEMSRVIRGRRDGLTVWINMDEPPVSKDYEWDLIVRGPCDHVAKEASAHIWDVPPPQPVTSEDPEKMVASQSVEVQVSPIPQRVAEKSLDPEKSIPTPASSRSSSILPLVLGKSKRMPLVGKKTNQKSAPKPKVKRASKPKAPSTKKGKKEPVLLGNPTLGFPLSKGDAADVKKPKPITPSEPLSPIDNADKENSLPAMEAKSNPQTPHRSSSISDTKPLSPVSDTSAGRPTKSTIEFILN